MSDPIWCPACGRSHLNDHPHLTPDEREADANAEAGRQAVATRVAAKLRGEHADCGCGLRDLATEDVLEVVREWNTDPELEADRNAALGRADQ